MARMMLEKNHNASICKTQYHRQFELDYVAVYTGELHKLYLNNHYNILPKQNTQNIPYSYEELFSFAKFCLTGKNDCSGHLREKGVEFIETVFYSFNDRYIIRIFAEHQYKAFLFKDPVNTHSQENTQSDTKQLMCKCTGLSEIHEKIMPLVRDILNVPEHISLPQFFRLFFLHHKEALHRLISDNNYQNMTSELMNSIINKEIKLCKQNDEHRFKFFSTSDSENVFTDYSIRFILDKIDKLENQKNIKIDSLKSYYRKKIKEQFGNEIKKYQKELTEQQKNFTIIKRKINSLRKMLKVKNNKENIEQLTLFNDCENKQNEDSIKEQLKLLQHKLSNVEFKQNYLRLSLEELQFRKQHQIEIYREQLMGIIAGFENTKLQERINLEALIEQKESYKHIIRQKQYTNNEISKKIVEVMENTINKYFEQSKLNYSIKLGLNHTPFIIDKHNSGTDLDKFNNKEKMLIALSFHLGLMDFSLNYGNNKNNNILPQFLLLNLSEINRYTDNDAINLIDFFRNNNKSRSFQLIIVPSQNIPSLV